MNNNFDLNRFGKYYIYELKNIWKNNGMLVLIFALIPAIFYMLYMVFGTLFSGDLELLFTEQFELKGPGAGVRLPIFVTMAVLFTAIFPSRAYGHITEKGRGSSWLMLPASRLEKFTSLVLNCIVAVPAAFLLTYTVSDWIVCLIDKSCGISILEAIFYDQSSWNSETDYIILCGNGIWILFSCMVQTSVTFILGALLFKKWKVLGTIFWMWVLGIMFSVAFGMAVNLSDMEEILENAEVWLRPHLPYFDIWINSTINFFLVIWVSITLIWSWFRLKKLQH